MADDVKLVAEALAGGTEAFAPIIERYQDAVFGVALARLRNYHDAQDVAQMVFIQAFGQLERLREAAKLGPWLRTMAIHKSIDYLRGKPPTVDIDEMEQDERVVAQAASEQSSGTIVG
jgi:RNA polymerase sigma-70 factor (ECF subfamily)